MPVTRKSVTDQPPSQRDPFRRLRAARVPVPAADRRSGREPTAFDANEEIPTRPRTSSAPQVECHVSSCDSRTSTAGRTWRRSSCGMRRRSPGRRGPPLASGALDPKSHSGCVGDLSDVPAARGRTGLVASDAALDHGSIHDVSVSCSANANRARWYPRSGRRGVFPRRAVGPGHDKRVFV
jgi:hypothetical protein